MVDAPPLRVAPIKFKFSQQIEHCRAETIEPRANTTGKWGFDSPPPRQPYVCGGSSKEEQPVLRLNARVKRRVLEKIADVTTGGDLKS
jgi:hypothetical protein